MAREKLEDQLIGQRIKLLSGNWEQTLVGVLVWIERDYFVIRQDTEVLLAVARRSIGAFSRVAAPPQRNSQTQSH